MDGNSLVTLTPKGFYCLRGGFYVDPWKPVDRAILTHAHSDHARPGSRRYLVAAEGERLARLRLGDEASITSLQFGEVSTMSGVKVSLHPAGHILGSAQVRIEHRGEVWVITGDYKLTPEPTCRPFELLQCHRLITEATFGLPIYRWPRDGETMEEINSWWRGNREKGMASVIFAYALGKAQRILAGVDSRIGPIFTHGAVERLTDAYRQSGAELPPTIYAGSVTGKKHFAGALIVAPPSAQASTWLRRFGNYSSGFASGWMVVRGARRQRAVDRGFVLSDHADWPELLTAIEAAKADRVYVTHGFAPELSRYLRERGHDAVALETDFGDESVEPELADEETEVPS